MWDQEFSCIVLIPDVIKYETTRLIQLLQLESGCAENQLIRTAEIEKTASIFL